MERRLQLRSGMMTALVTTVMLVVCTSTTVGVAGSAQVNRSHDPANINLASYQAVVKKALAGPKTWEGPTTPVKAPKHIKLAIIECAGFLEGCADPANAAASAARSLGWSVILFDGKGDPPTQNRLMHEAVARHINAILTFSIDPSFIGSGLTAAHAHGIVVGSSAQGVAPSRQGFAFDVGANWSDVGYIQGNWFVVDSKGKAVLLPMIDREYSSVVASVDSAVHVVRTCSSCTVLADQEFVGANVGSGLGQRVVSLLRRDPRIDYVLGTYDPAAADIATAIANAGLSSRVKLMGQIGLHQNFELIRSGRGQVADVAFDQVYTGYATVDQLIRVLTHHPLFKSKQTHDPRFEYGENVPIKLITQANVPPPGQNYVAPFNTINHFRQLWGLPTK